MEWFIAFASEKKDFVSNIFLAEIFKQILFTGLGDTENLYFETYLKRVFLLLKFVFEYKRLKLNFKSVVG